MTGQFAILHSKYDMPPSKYSPKLTNLIIVMLAENPNLRPNIYQVLYHICSIIGVKVPIVDIYGEGPYNFELYSNFQSKFQRVQFEIFDLERKRTDPSYRLTNQENMRLNDLFFSMFNVAPKIPLAVPSSGPSSTSVPQNVGVSAPASGSASTSNTAFMESTASFKDSSSTNKKIGDNSDHVGQLDTSSAQSEKVDVATTTTTTTTTVEDTTNANGPLDDNRSEEEIETFYPKLKTWIGTSRLRLVMYLVGNRSSSNNSTNHSPNISILRRCPQMLIHTPPFYLNSWPVLSQLQQMYCLQKINNNKST